MKDFYTLSPLGDQRATELVERAVRNAKPNRRGKHYRWVAVMDAFGCGSTMAYQLCRHHGLDPDEMISRL